MLVLSRKKSETVIIHENGREIARLMVVEIRGDKIRLGVAAPAEVTVDRSEVYEAKIRKEQALEPPAETLEG